MSDNNSMIYICSPYKGDVKRNKGYARHLTRVAIENGFAPVAVHLYITEVMRDEEPEERDKGMRVGQEILKQCKYMLVGDKYGISPGMEEEIKMAREEEITILYEKDEKVYLIQYH